MGCLMVRMTEDWRGKRKGGNSVRMRGEILVNSKFYRMAVKMAVKKVDSSVGHWVVLSALLAVVQKVVWMAATMDLTKVGQMVAKMGSI